MFRGKPWIIMGDFNEVLEGGEHSGYDSDPSISGGMRDFQRVTRHCCLTDNSYQGPLFTWCNKREAGLICKKLDRVLVNDVWLLQLSQAYSLFDSGGCSDHLRSRTIIKQEEEKKGDLSSSQMLLEKCKSLSSCLRSFRRNLFFISLDISYA